VDLRTNIKKCQALGLTGECMTLKDKTIIEYQNLSKSYLGIEMSFEQAKVEANHLVRVLRILKRRTI